jgi:hypothetical protein
MLVSKLESINQILAVINVHTMVGEWVGNNEMDFYGIFMCIYIIIVYTNIVSFNMIFLLVVGEWVIWWKLNTKDNIISLIFIFLHHDKKRIIGFEVAFMVTRAIVNVLSNMPKK